MTKLNVKAIRVFILCVLFVATFTVSSNALSLSYDISGSTWLNYGTMQAVGYTTTEDGSYVADQMTVATKTYDPNNNLLVSVGASKRNCTSVTVVAPHNGSQWSAESTHTIKDHTGNETDYSACML